MIKSKWKNSGSRNMQFKKRAEVSKSENEVLNALKEKLAPELNAS